MVLFIAHAVDFAWMGRDVARCLTRRLPFPEGFPTEELARARITARTDETVGRLLLAPYEAEIVSFYYRRIAQQCRELKALPVCAYLPVPQEQASDRARVAELKNLAEKAGFIFIDLSAVFSGRTPDELSLGDRWHHTNANANALIAAQLYDRLTTDPRIDLLARAKRIRHENIAGNETELPARP